jgi:AraC-like DNA-binding protein
MSNRLWMIKDWEERAHAAQYCVKELARQCDIPVQTLRRFLREKFGLCPKEWLKELRMKAARLGLVKGMCVYQVAAEQGYANPVQFSRAFKSYHGYPPKEHVRRTMRKE